MTRQQETISAKDREVLRRLADRVAYHAAQSIQEERRKEWTRHNALDAGRPLIWSSPEGCWIEIVKHDNLECDGELARSWEYGLRMELVWAEFIRDDRVIKRQFDVGPIVTDDGWGVEIPLHHGEGRGSYVWDAPIADYERDMPNLHHPNRVYHKEATEARIALAKETLGDLLDVHFKADWGWFIPVTMMTINLRGLERLMTDMYDEPENLKRLLAFVQEGGHKLLDWAEENDLLTLNNNIGIASGGFGWTRELPAADFTGQVRPKDMWGFAESQETVGVSTAMFEEFILPLQIGWCERFGLNCYGCCEPVDKRWSAVRKIPRLRRVSVSPWSNVDKMAENLGPNYVFSWKPSPTDLAMEAFHEDQVREKVRHTLEVCKANDCRLEMIMKDTHTVRGEPERIQRWVSICREEICRVYGE